VEKTQGLTQPSKQNPSRCVVDEASVSRHASLVREMEETHCLCLHFNFATYGSLCHEYGNHTSKVTAAAALASIEAITDSNEWSMHDKSSV
jgi:hypothetical protein